MADNKTLLDTMRADGTITTLARNPLAQFGIPARRYIGAEILPEVLVNENAYRETQIRYRTVIANDGTRYSPVQLKSGELVGEFLVELGESDIGRQFTGREYDALLRLLGNGITMDAMVALVNWIDVAIVRALVEHNEKQRFEALVNASTVRQGDNGYTETVTYSDPAGHRAAAATPWTTDAYDPFEDIFAMADLLASKGYTVSRIITSRQVISVLAGNDKVKARTGLSVVSPTGQIMGAAGRATRDQINGALGADGLPPLEVYDLQYRTQTGTGHFLPRNTMLFVSFTGQDRNIDLGDNDRVAAETLGYTAVGRGVGQAGPGRVVIANAFDDKPPRIHAEGWQTSLPVITEPEAIAVITDISG
jgi:hypothetical protein